MTCIFSLSYRKSATPGFICVNRVSNRRAIGSANALLQLRDRPQTPTLWENIAIGALI
ncbi:hypothetical protein QUB13_25585 [Microcoleus sp. B4-D4]